MAHATETELEQWRATKQYWHDLIETRRDLEADREPACWAWPVTLERLEQVAASDQPHYEMRDWQQGLCAVCGQDLDLQLDHDHDTALIRGWLCQHCNLTEPGGRAVFLRYREKNPATMLGIRRAYVSPFFGTAQPVKPVPLEQDPSLLVAAATALEDESA